MKKTGTCPKCAGRKLFHIASVEQTLERMAEHKAIAVIEDGVRR